MYNSNKPTAADLPTSAQLLKSTVIAIITAIVILITIVLPSEYAIDPTGVGRMLKLTEMGEIKQQLAEEATKDHQQEEQKAPAAGPSSSLFTNPFAFLIGTAQAQSAWTDEVSYTLEPGQGIEVKLAMEKNAEVEFKWVAEGGRLNYDLHGNASRKETSYKKGRGVPGDEGVLKAGFTGKHGWFWRNRDKQDVTFTLYVRGAYSEVIRPKQ